MSGLLLYRPFARATIAGTPLPSLKNFFIRRATRLLPVFWLMTAVALVLLNWGTLHGAWDVVRPFALMHIYDFHYYPGLDVAWTVPAETQFYLALPLLAFLMHRVARGATDPVQKARRMLLVLAVFLPVEWGWTLYVHIHYKMWPPQYFYPMSIVGLWALGMALAVWSVRAEVAPDRAPGIIRLAAKRPNLFWLGALAAYAINCAAPFSTPGTADWQSPSSALSSDLALQAFSFLLMVPLAVPYTHSKLMKVLLANRPMRYLGRISYGMYIWHFTFIYVVLRSGSAFGKIIPINLLLGKLAFWQLYLPVLAGTILAASISFYIFEKPLIGLGERIILRGKRPALAPATPSTAPVPVAVPVPVEKAVTPETIEEPVAAVPSG